MPKSKLISLFILLILVPAIFLQGCLTPSPAPLPAQPTDAYTESEEQDYPPELLPAVHNPLPGRFTLRYDPNSSFNPLTTLNRDNIILTSLMYESLFVLNRHLMPEPQLAAYWSTQDNVRFLFELKPDILMHDGTYLTAQDAVYSIRQASRIGRFSGRFNTLSRLEATGDLTFTIELSAPNSRFIHLLDIPIIKNGTSGSHLPPGSGPYQFPFGTAPWLIAFSNHRDYENLPLSMIYLRDCADTELTELFDTGELSLLWDDPADAFEIRLNRLRETRYFETTSLQFLGFNANHIALRDPDVRRAISVSIDRQYIVENVMRPGLTVAAPLAISPVFHLYDERWEVRDFPPLEEMALLFERAGLYDFNNDSFLELSDGHGGYIVFTIDFIVNIENTHKVKAAHEIANRLRRNGLNVTVRELPWNRFMEALNSGNFDMFYGEVQLSADFDLSPLLLPGPLNFGRTASTAYRHLIDDFLSARYDDEIRWAAQRLVDEIYFEAPFAPILYKRHVIYSPIGAIVGADPSQSNVFRNITAWTVNLMMLN
ncbi:MAG: ABC transporter substrate-binding protein [Oscillospiraceae bacterium]|nr:ABC transporter substrate-binding protein [Oscillospiraceae bacterium]